MRRVLLIATLIVALTALSGCGGGDAADSSDTKPEQEDTPITYSVMAMDANAEAAVPSAEIAEEYVVYEEEGGEVEGEDYLDIRGLEPSFVGYEIVAWRVVEGSDDIEYAEVNYFDGLVADWFSSPDEQMSEPVDLDTMSSINVEGLSMELSADEQAAIDAAEATLAEVMPDFAYESIAIDNYIFVYEVDGEGQVIGAGADGEINSWSDVISAAVQ